MDSLRLLDRPLGLDPGDHAAWAFDDAAALRRAAVDYLEEGSRRGERLMLVGAGEPADLRVLVDGMDHVAALLERGQLSLHPAREAYRLLAGDEHDRQVEALLGAAASALAAGYTGLRVWADVTELTTDSDLLCRLLDYELVVDRVSSTRQTTLVCALDTRRAGDHWSLLAPLHRVQRRRESAPRFALTVVGSEEAVQLLGEIDTVCTVALREVLRRARRLVAGPLVVDLSQLEFLDVAGARALARFRQELATAGDVVRFVNARGVVGRVLETFGLVAEPGR